MKNKTVITGIGIWSCLGRNVNEVAKSLYEGRCGLKHDPLRTEYGYQSSIVGDVPELSESDVAWIKPSLRKCMTDLSLRAAVAVKEALESSGIKDLSRTALIVSNDSTAEAMHEVEDIMREKKDTRYLRSFRVFQSLNSTVSMNLAQIFGIGGLSLTVSAACAGGGHAVGLAHTLIQSGMIDSAIVVGAQEIGIHAFTSFDALGVFPKDVEATEASRPFDANRKGLVPSGGAACVILESVVHAGNREAMFVHACIEGYGFSTSPNIVSPSSESIKQCMQMALDNAQCKADAIDFVAAHATGTHDGDKAEADAISSVFGADGYCLTATKGLTGHECWMAGVSQIVYTLVQMGSGFVAPHPNYLQPDPQLPPLPLSHKRAEGVSLSLALCNAFGFGGTNSSLVISAF